MKIYTLTLNPAYDIHAYADALALHCENLADIRSREAGGKGVNISRALQSGKIPNTALIVLGKDNGEDFKKALSGLDCILLEKEGRIRENLTIHCHNAPETRISFAGFSVDDSLLDAVFAQLNIEPDTIVTFTGRVPQGISMACTKAFLKKLRDMGARIVLDSKSFTKEDIFEIRPWLIKPNQEEISEYLGCQVHTLAQALEKASVFADNGIANTMVSLGEQGAILLCGGKAYLANCPAIDAISTIGAGDSAIAGFLTAAYQGKSPARCLKTAVAYGTAACMTPGTLPPKQEDLEKIYGQVHVKEVK